MTKDILNKCASAFQFLKEIISYGSNKRKMMSYYLELSASDVPCATFKAAK
jgi:hypothetical protein